MDQAKLATLREALETAILNVADKRLNELTKGKTKREIAEAIVRTLRSCEQLQSGVMPEYNNWDALYYPLWYQPSHINMAYSLIEQIPTNINPLIDGKGQLYVTDLGAGQWAMQLALLLWAAEVKDTSGYTPIVQVDSRDPEKSMWYTGLEIWRAFIAEVSNSQSPEFSSAREVLKSFRSRKFSMTVVRERQEAILWLTLLHVAYQQSADSIGKQVCEILSKSKPDLLLVTCHRGARDNAFAPPTESYTKISELTFPGQCESLLNSNLDRLSAFRRMLYTEFVTKNVPERDENFARNYLTTHPSAFVTHQFEATCSIFASRNLSSKRDL